MINQFFQHYLIRRVLEGGVWVDIGMVLEGGLQGGIGHRHGTGGGLLVCIVQSYGIRGGRGMALDIGMVLLGGFYCINEWY